MEEDVKIRIKEELKAAKARLKAAKLLLEKGMLEDAVNRLITFSSTQPKPCSTH